MIHGDLKGVRFDGWSYPTISPSLPVQANILIDQTCHARLADFGLLSIISDPANILSSSSYTQGGTARWMSPELINPQRFGFENSYPTKSSDCYAFGMVIYETISGHLPFYKYADLTVFVKVLEGERPLRKAGFADSLWEMLELCWAPEPKTRPNPEDVLYCLERASQSWETPPPEVNGGMGKGDDWDSESGSSGMFSHCTPSLRLVPMCSIRPCHLILTHHHAPRILISPRLACKPQVDAIANKGDVGGRQNSYLTFVFFYSSSPVWRFSRTFLGSQF